MAGQLAIPLGALKDIQSPEPPDVELSDADVDVSPTPLADRSRRLVLPASIVPSDQIPAPGDGRLPSPLNALGIEVVSDEAWAAMTPKERMDGLLRAAGYAVTSMMGLGAQGRETVDNPKTTLATIAIPAGLGATARSAVPYVAPAARAAANALENPLVGAGIGGATEGYRTGTVGGVVTGATTGAVSSVIGGRPAARQLRKLANKYDPPTPRVNPSTVASERMIAGMSAPTPTAAPAPAAASPASPAASTPVAGTPGAAPVAPAAAAPSQSAGPGAHSRPAPMSDAPASVPGPTVPAWDKTGQTLHLPPAARTKGQMSEGWIRSDIGIAAKRSKVPLTDAEVVQAAKLVREGQTPMQAVQTIGAGKSQAAPATARPAVPAGKPRLEAAEAREYSRLQQMGKSPQEAMELIEAQRLLTKSLGTPTVKEAKTAVAERNATGRWPRRGKE